MRLSLLLCLSVFPVWIGSRFVLRFVSERVWHAAPASASLGLRPNTSPVIVPNRTVIPEGGLDLGDCDITLLDFGFADGICCATISATPARMHC